MEKHEQEPEDTNPIPPSKMHSLTRKTELESTSPYPPSILRSPPREPELEPESRNPPPKILSPPRKPQLEPESRNPSRKILSPPQQLEPQSQNPPPKILSPPCEQQLEPQSRNPPQKILSPQREQKLEPQSRKPPPKILSPSREPELEPQSRNPAPKILSPPREPELEPTNSIPPSRMLSPPLQPHHSFKSQSPPLDFPPEEEEDGKKPPFKPLTTPDADTVAPVTTKVGPTFQEVDEERSHSNIGNGRKFLRPNLSILKRAKRENMVKRALLGFRVCGFVFSLVSFSVMAADRNRGWALDSFYRYKEFRYSMAVNVMAFAYSGFQAYDLVYQLTAGKRKVRQHLRYYLDFSVDQILTYLLISASSSAAVRVDDWQSNWGKDEFPEMARASVALSFLAFVALAFGSLVSGYTLYSLKST